jgi:hypothetical protein
MHQGIQKLDDGRWIIFEMSPSHPPHVLAYFATRHEAEAKLLEYRKAQQTILHQGEILTIEPVPTKHRYWCGEVGPLDDFGATIVDTFIDAPTPRGWAKMTPENWELHGLRPVGLGLGRGQRYTRQPDGRWLKTGG